MAAMGPAISLASMGWKPVAVFRGLSGGLWLK
jgi:hypothetical protein